MSEQPTERELQLARRVAELEAQLQKPTIDGGGMAGTALNLAVQNVPRKLLAFGLAVFIAYHAWGYYNEGLQLVYETHRTEAEAAEKFAQRDALLKADADDAKGEALIVAQYRADIAKVEAEARVAKAQANAARVKIGDLTARQRQLRAELKQAKAAALNARTKRDALMQIIEGTIKR